jgi:hypothetical protein
MVLLMTATLAWSLGGAVWLAVGLLEDPGLGPAPAQVYDAIRADQKVGRALRPPRGDPGRAGADIVLTEAEVSAFLSRHLPAAVELSFTGIRVELPGHERVEFAGEVPLRAVLAELPLAAGIDLLPLRWREHPVWIRLRARARLELGPMTERRYLQLAVERLWVGRRRLPALLLRIGLSPLRLRVLEWPLPQRVDDIRLETGQVVIRVGRPP